MNEKNPTKTKVCQICGKDHHAELRPGVLVRPAIAQLIEKETGHWSEAGWICLADLHRFRQQYVRSLLELERGELTAIDREVLESLEQHEILARNPETGFARSVTTR